MPKYIILSDGQTNIHRVASIPDDVKFPRKGNLTLDVEILGYSKSFDEAVVRLAQEKKKANTA
ncbi:hypothetical protein [Desulfuromonas sp. TF]|uniref:hypothetical protein n=1 Tax=Desulfuromonas sp. TF TaxID=1232410 RepID=UPI0003FCBF66|nr:hypothetical protein [Desulfuromonas sp. TF]